MKYLAVVLLSVGLAGCSPPDAPLRVGILEWPPYEIVRLAEHLDFFPDGSIEIVEFRSPVEAARAYMAGGLDIIALNLDVVLEFWAGDDDHRVIVVINESLGGDAVIGRAPYERLQDIAGKRVGMQAGELGAHILSRLLEEAGLAHGEIEIAYIDFSDQPEAFRRGQVDLMITYEPVRSELLANGGHEVFSSARIPGEILDVFVARQSLIERRVEDFSAFANGWFHAIQAFLAAPSDCAVLLAPRFGLDAPRFLAALDGVRLFSLPDNRRVLGQGNGDFIEAIGNVVRSVPSFSAAAASADLERLFTDALLPADAAIELAAAAGDGC